VVPFDWTGRVCAVLALAALTYGVIEGGRQGYGSTPILAAFAVAVAASAAFLAAQGRGRRPLVPLELFRSRAVAILLAAGFIGMVGYLTAAVLPAITAAAAMNLPRFVR
jgi:MFS transporter, DHA2 family, methylenomycin A resistance protein